MVDSAGKEASGAADAAENQSSYLSSSQTVVIYKEKQSWHFTPVLTYEIVRLANIVVPHGHLQGLFGEVCIFDVITELLQKTEKENQYDIIQLQYHFSSFKITTKA